MTKRNTGFSENLLRADDLGEMASYDEGRAQGDEQGENYGNGQASPTPDIGCAVKQLPERLLFRGAEVGRESTLLMRQWWG
jgi:hypothetical protein